MSDLIERQAAIKAVNNAFDRETLLTGFVRSIAVRAIRDMPTAQPEQKIYRSMSEEEFEAWLYNHGICHPDFHESIACDIVPSLIDDAINELTPVPPSEAIPVSWIEAKITQLISMDNEFAGLTVHIIKTLLNEWKAEQRSPEVDHDAQVREFAEEMSKHGVT